MSLTPKNASKTVLFFPGDIQQRSVDMQRTYPDYVDFSYENTCKLLAKRFGDDHNVVLWLPCETLLLLFELNVTSFIVL